VIGFGLAVIHHASWLYVLASVPVVVVLAASANHCAERANDELADWDQARAP
jgi:hypothetical protein